MDGSWMFGDFKATSRLIAPVAFQPLNACMRSLDAEVALGVVIESGTQILPVAPPSSLRGEDFSSLERAASLQMLTEALDRLGREYTLWNNTARSTSAEEASYRAMEGYRITGSPYIKFEIFRPFRVGIEETFMPADGEEMYVAVTKLLRDHSYQFFIIPYIKRDLKLALNFEQEGICALRIYASPIGLGQGLGDEDQLEEIISCLKIPVIVEGGIGLPSHAKRAMELGAAAVLVNTAITTASDPVSMAREFKEAVERGRGNYLRRPNR